MLFRRLVVWNSTILVFLTAVFVWYNLTSTQKIVEEEVYNSFYTSMDTGAAELASVFRDARNLTLELCANTSVQRALRQDDAAWQDEEQKIQAARQSSENLTRFFPTFNAEIYGLDAEHQLFGADNIKNISEEWLQAVLRAQGQFVWDYHYTEYGSGVRVSHLIYDEQNWEQPLGIVSVYVNSDYLRYALNSIRLGNNTVVYLLDAKGNLLFPYETGASIPENVGETVTIAGSASGRSAFVMRRLSVNGFRIVGEAESRVHACPLEEVHFHETGAVDSIVDIVGAAACAVDLGITETYVSTIYEGQGHVWCQHGRIPVPAPAVAGIAAAEELDLAITNVSGEMVTPTGAAIAAALRTKKGLPKTFVIRKIGMGAGKKDFPHANLLRAMIIEQAMNGLPAGNAVEEPTRSVNADGDSQKNGSSAKEKSSSDETEDEIWVLETNLDDCTGEMMGLTMELLLAAGARDVNYTPIYMKKNRPACKLEVLCKEEKVSALEEVIFHQTTAIGLRKRKEVRRILPRKKETVMTPYGEVELKICTSAGETYIYPEYDSIRGLVQETGRSYQEIYQKAVEEAWKKRKND